MSPPEPSSPQQRAEAVQALMLRHDAFTQWLGLTFEEVGPGHCRLRLPVRPEMRNGFGTLHGGILFAAADSALGFASNSHGRFSVALSATIDYLAPAHPGDVLTVEAREESLRHTIGVYAIRVTNQANVLIALFKGTAYRSSKDLSSMRNEQ